MWNDLLYAAGMRWGATLLGAYCLVALAALTWPVFPTIAGEPLPLLWGVPRNLFYSAAWIVVTFAVGVLYEITQHRRRKR